MSDHGGLLPFLVFQARNHHASGASRSLYHTSAKGGINEQNRNDYTVKPGGCIHPGVSLHTAEKMAWQWKLPFRIRTSVFSILLFCKKELKHCAHRLMQTGFIGCKLLDCLIEHHDCLKPIQCRGIVRREVLFV